MDDEINEYPNVPQWQRDIVARKGHLLNTGSEEDVLELLNIVQTPTSEPDGATAPASNVGSPERAREAMLRNLGSQVLAQVELLRQLEEQDG